jgi:hypothetical protein
MKFDWQPNPLAGLRSRMTIVCGLARFFVTVSTSRDF